MGASTLERARTAAAAARLPRSVAVAVVDVSRSFDEVQALRGVSLEIADGEICALLGPNGAGKTTLVRILAGLQTPTAGAVSVLGRDVAVAPDQLRAAIGLVPSGDRTFYLRISGLENLVFFARLNGMRRRAAAARALEVLEQVGLAEAAHRPVGTYSHGMQKRLGVARALLTRPPVLLVDEATHDLDPVGAEQVRALVRAAADAGAAVLWATQRLDEIRRFADHAILLNRGLVGFSGSVAELLEHATRHRFLLQVGPHGIDLEALVDGALGGRAALTAVGPAERGHYVLSLADGVVLGDAVAVLAREGVPVIACRQDGSEVEQAFLSLVADKA
jgi:ABC-2 type transport system ATP-binding protein